MEVSHSRKSRYAYGNRKLKWAVVMLAGFLAGFLASGLLV